MWGYILLAVALLLAACAYYVLVHQRCLEPFDVAAFTIEPATLVYVTYRGDYYQLMPTVDAIKRDLDKYFAGEGHRQTSETVSMCGVYYDIPQTLVDPTQARALLGFLVRDDDHVEVAAFMKAAKQSGSGLQYAQIKLGRLQAYGSHFPLLGTASLMSNIVRGYPAIREWASRQPGSLLERTVCSVETYQWAQQSMGICFVYGKNAQLLFGLSKYPQPAIKSNVQVKTLKKLH